jgi:protein HOOK3
MDSTESLIKWLKTFETLSEIKTYKDLSNGLILSQILTQIIPQFFTNEWLEKIDKNDFEINAKIRENNLRIICEKILEYFTQIEIKFEDKLLPNLTKIALSDDKQELGLLLQLVLGLTINCDNKSYFVDVINGLDFETQKGLMNAIKNLKLDKERVSATTMKQLEEMKRENNELKEKLLEKLKENEMLSEKVEKNSFENKEVMNRLIENLDSMRSELMFNESEKNDLKSKCDLFEKELKELREENTEFKYNNRERNDQKDQKHQNYRFEYLSHQLSHQLSHDCDVTQPTNHLLVNKINQIKHNNKQLQQLRLKLGEELFRNEKIERNLKVFEQKFEELVKENEKLKEIKNNEELNDLLKQKEKEIQVLREEKSLRETEVKLMSISYHKMSSLLQRKSSEERILKNVSFLSKQRLSKKCLKKLNENIFETHF